MAREHNERGYLCDLYTAQEDNKVRCHCCRFRCLIKDGGVGHCQVRFNVGGKLYLAVYGKPSASHNDPIEKKPLYHFLPGTTSFSIGTLGCNMRCLHCQNWSLSQGIECSNVANGDIEELAKVATSGRYTPPEAVVEAAIRNGSSSIAFTYNEGTLFAEYAHDIAKLAAAQGLKCVYVSNGLATREHLEYARPYIQAINIDLKGFTKEFYSRVCSASLDHVKQGIIDSVELGYHTEITTLLIPGENDTEEELREMATWIANVSRDIVWHLSAFHPDYKMTNKEPTPVATMLMARRVGRECGLRYVYMGNLSGTEYHQTACPECKKIIIDRGSWGHQTRSSLEDGKCPFCGFAIAGVWA